jgi:DNA-binding NtrC family response regulator
MKHGMSRLLHDRYYAYAPEHAWDLATGETVRIDEIAENPTGESCAPASLVEVLDHGREGEPRWVVADTGHGPRPSVVARRAAAAASARGFVPVSAEVYLRRRQVLDDDLQHRSLLLIGHPSTSLARGRTALVDAAARSPRPHVLLTFASPRPERAGVVREARAVYGARHTRPAIPAAFPEDVLKHVARAARAAEFTSTGRHAAAERLLRDVTAALVRREATVPAAHTAISLGRLLLERGRAIHAEAVFAEAAAHAHAARDESLSLSARVWQASARIDAGQLTAAESLCRAALLTGMLVEDERARAHATLARILLRQGRIEEAAALDMTCSDAVPERTAYVSSIAIRVLLATGEVFQAGQRARALLDASGSSTSALVRVLALSAHTRVLMTTGDVALVEERMTHVQRAAQEARAPLRVTRMRLLLHDLYRRSGRNEAADRERDYLRRLQPAAPPLLRHEIGRGLAAVAAAPRSRSMCVLERDLAAAMVAMVQEHENDKDAISRTLAFVAEFLQTSRVELWSADAGPPTAVITIGSGLTSSIGPRIVEAGIAIVPEANGAGGEHGVPVRLGSRLLGALCARWPVDRISPRQTASVLELAAALLAPRVETMLVVARGVATASTSIPELVGVSDAINEVRRAVTRAASAPFAVLIEGESGAGKELVARAIHSLSPRRERRFCDLNCAALPDELLESELFGHARGAFTGAITERAGLVEEADGGTLFLDEVPDLSGRAQAKLLRVLQQQEVRRVGESFSRKVDVRIVSAANRDMRAESVAGRFRQDLLYRLDVIRIRVPPLRERPEDIAVLAQHFWSSVAPRVGTRASLAHSTLTALAGYSWPGNVRELQNVMSALAVAAPAYGQVRAALLPRVVTSLPVVSLTRLTDARAQFERRFIELALARAGGRRARAARELGLSRQGLLKMLARLGLSRPGEGDR